MIGNANMLLRPFSSIFILVIALQALALAGCSTRAGNPSTKQTSSESTTTKSQDAADDLGPVADFSLTERSGKNFRLADLRGKVWVASFLFTRCCTGCPRISADLLELQKNLPEGAVIVSFSVDPEYDTPPVLKAYADTLGADPKHWLFLTGKQDVIYRLIKDSFHLGVEQNQGEARTKGNEVTHSNRLIVVDRQGLIRGWDFDGTNPEDLPRLKQRIEELLREKP
jgi:cytochrome oxidase Cu insertion factor (SCO1/SenC/PrrC family)